MMSLSVGGCTADPAAGLELIVKSFEASMELAIWASEQNRDNNAYNVWPSASPPTIEELEANARDCDASAQYRLVLRLQDSEPERALYWLRLSAHDGYAPAQYDYANVNRYGSDLVAPDYVQAYLWYSLALFDHNYSIDPSGVAFWRDDLAVQMTEAEIAEAERLVAGWEPAPCVPETA
jgi:hypothetical protein